MSHFKYSSLDTSKHEIRLVCPVDNIVSAADNSLVPGPEEPLLRYVLETVSMDRVPSYTALSYTWGDNKNKKQIVLNGETFAVTKNLEIALQHINREGRSGALWIDSICINQEDDNEKTEQVQRMKNIYEEANQVLVWLGPTADNGDIVMDFLAEVGKQAHDFGLPDTSQHTKSAWPESQSDERLQKLQSIANRIIDSAGHITLIEAFSAFAARDWWGHVWVTQELAVAKDAVFALGDKRVSYTYVHAGVSFWNSQSMQIVRLKYKDKSVKELYGDKVFKALSNSSVYPAFAKLSYTLWYRGESLNKSKPLYPLLLRALIPGTGGGLAKRK